MNSEQVAILICMAIAVIGIVLFGGSFQATSNNGIFEISLNTFTFYLGIAFMAAGIIGASIIGVLSRAR